MFFFQLAYDDKYFFTSFDLVMLAVYVLWEGQQGRVARGGLTGVRGESVTQKVMAPARPTCGARRRCLVVVLHAVA
jgi:hypothetical protein